MSGRAVQASAPVSVGHPAARRRGIAWSLLPACVMFCVAFWDIGGASYWRDEAATLSAVKRPLPVMWHMLGGTDVVHSWYYFLMWPLVRLLGTAEWATRLPSALAMAAAAGGIDAIGRRLVSPRMGLAAALAFAAFPITSRYGQETRPYAMEVALAVLASYLLVRTLDANAGARSRWRAGYTIALASAGWMNLMGLLIIPAHGLTVALTRRSAHRGGNAVSGAPDAAVSGAPDAAVAGQPERFGSWLAAVAAAMVLVLPLIVLVWPQRHGTTQFIALMNPKILRYLPFSLTGSWPVFYVALALVAAGQVVGRRGRARLNRLCLPWLLPPLILALAGTFIPVYDARYFLFCVPAVALLAGFGMDALATRIGTVLAARAGTVPVVAVAAATLALLLAGTAGAGVPEQLAYRAGNGHFDNIRRADRILAAHERRGDAVLYNRAWWRQLESAYPYGLAKLRDISLKKTPDQAGNFTGVQYRTWQIRQRLRSVRRVWLVEILSFRPVPALEGGAWRATRTFRANDILLTLYRRVRGRASP